MTPNNAPTMPPLSAQLTQPYPLRPIYILASAPTHPCHLDRSVEHACPAAVHHMSVAGAHLIGRIDFTIFCGACRTSVFELSDVGTELPIWYARRMLRVEDSVS
jgi:hypothetical protein